MSFKHFKHPLFATEMLNLNDCRDAAMLVLFRDISYGILCSNESALEVTGRVTYCPTNGALGYDEDMRWSGRYRWETPTPGDS